MDEAKKPRRRWFQFSLRKLFVVVTAIACWLGLGVMVGEAFFVGSLHGLLYFVLAMPVSYVIIIAIQKLDRWLRRAK